MTEISAGGSLDGCELGWLEGSELGWLEGSELAWLDGCELGSLGGCELWAKAEVASSEAAATIARMLVFFIICVSCEEVSTRAINVVKGRRFPSSGVLKIC